MFRSNDARFALVGSPAGVDQVLAVSGRWGNRAAVPATC